jgi:aminoglycoside 6'-N-acetyltransferase I
LIVRRAAERDVEVWASMLARLHPGETQAEFEEELHRLTQLPEPYVGFLAYSDEGEPIGMIDARVRNYAEGAPDLRAAYVEDLWVEPKARRSGVALALLAAVEDWARSQGLNWIGSDTWPDNRESCGWHSAAGFAEIERLVVFGKPLD